MARAKPKTKLNDLTLAYLEDHPSDAARVLEMVGIDELSALAAMLPARVVAPVITHMLPNTAARALLALEDGEFARLLRPLGVQSVTAILRCVPEARRAGIFAQLPAGLSAASRLLLSYPSDSVGSMMDVNAVAVPPETSVRDALARLRQVGEGVVDYVYAVDRDRRLVGGVALPALLQAPPSQALSNILDRGVPAISAQATMSAAHAHEAWNRYHVLPVIERRGAFVGALRHTELARVAARARPAAEERVLEGSLHGVALAYWNVADGLMQAIVAALPARSPNQGERP